MAEVLITHCRTEFIIACIICGLEYLHTKGIVHRDIKPSNLVIDSEGYIKLADFGISQRLSKDCSPDTSGTPGYMGMTFCAAFSLSQTGYIAPEVIWKKNHGVAVDYFALGVVAYELMMQVRPYKGSNRKDCQYEIWSKEVQLTRANIPAGWSAEAADFINKVGFFAFCADCLPRAD